MIFKEVSTDFKFWRFFLFSLVLVGPKLVFALLFFMLPKIIIQDYGEDAPFGIYVSIAPLMIIIFLFCVQTLQNNYDPYDLILLGTAIETTGPIPMFFGMNIVDFVFFIIIISFAEALYAPMINVFTFTASFSSSVPCLLIVLASSLLSDPIAAFYSCCVFLWTVSI